MSERASACLCAGVRACVHVCACVCVFVCTRVSVCLLPSPPEGKIRHYGLSNETTFGVCEFVRAADELGVPRPVSIQNSFSLVHRSFEDELAEACAPSHYNIGLLPWSPLAGGEEGGGIGR